MFYMKNSGKHAVAIPNASDLRALEQLGIKLLADNTKSGSLKDKALIQRLVNGGYLPEGFY